MIPETSVNWKAFEYKFSDNPQRAFENLTYFLFCHEFNQKNGIFRYFNQPHIETNPIQVGEKVIGFQSKYYSDSVAMSSKESELIRAIEGAKKTYPNITTLYFYISHEFSPSSKKNYVKPSYQINIESTAQTLGLEIVWRGTSNIEAQLMQDKQLTVCRNVFFQVDSSVINCCENLNKHKNDLFDHINTSITYKENRIVLENNEINFENFLSSNNQILLVDGDAGSGKSALVKKMLVNINENNICLAFKSTDMDVNDKLDFFTLYGSLIIDEVVDIYKEADSRIIYIDAAEKYYILDYQQTFEDILQAFIKAGWKIIITLRTAYKESFRNLLLNKIKVQEYHVNSISNDKLSELSNIFGFKLPKDKILKNLICAPFYLGLYLALDNIDDEEMLALNREVFEEKIWESIIRNNKKRKNSMPTRREDTLIHLTKVMLQNESYLYDIQSNDDYEALSELEQSGILIQTDDARKFCHSHDVFEELVVSHIFMEQYKRNIEGEQFFSQFRPSLRIRKLFRGWLSDFASIENHQDIIFKILEGQGIDRIWKDEVLLTVISTENLKNVYDKIALNMADDNCEMLKKIAFLINTCCSVADHTDLYLSQGNLFPFRIAKPSGYAWEALFSFINHNKNSLIWDKELISICITVLDSWTKHYENAKTENTRIAGEIAGFIFDKISHDNDLRYSVRDEQITKIQDILLNSAWMIKEYLSNIFQIVLNGVNYEEDISFPLAVRNGRPNAPTMYIDLAERAVSDIYHFGNVPYALPELTIELMKKMWIKQGEVTIYHSSMIEIDFGLNTHLSNEYYPASAYKTPIFIMLQHGQKITTDFLIHLCNESGKAYASSNLNKDYGECFKVSIHIGDRKVEQIASDRLWKMYRGTHVGPNLLVSVLMGFERWLLTVVKNSEMSIIVDYCRYILLNTKNVMLTAVIVSIAEAYPEKMIDIICDLLKTKEIFNMDTSRLTSEQNASFLLFGNNQFEKERLESAKLPHRSKRLEDVILEYQTDSSDISEEEFNLRREKVYKAIDDATVDIDSWETSYKYAYYRMDLRHYREIVDVYSDEQGYNICTVVPDFSEDMKKQREQGEKTYDSNWKYIELQLWSDYKFHGNKKFEKYVKYSEVTVVYKEFLELWTIILNYEHQDQEELNSLLLKRYISIISYTSVVLLRDYKNDLEEDNIELCEHIILEIGDMFTHVSDYELHQVGNGFEAIIVGLILIINENNRKIMNNNNPLYQLIQFLLTDSSHDSLVIEKFSSTIWKHSKCDGWRIVYLFSLFSTSYNRELMKNRELSAAEFLKNNNEILKQVMERDSVEITDIDFTNLDKISLFSIILMVSYDLKEAFIIAEITKDTAMRLTFSDKNNLEREHINLNGYILNYIVWFADVLLHCNDDERRVLISLFIERADILGNDNTEHLFTWLINNQELYNKPNEFWCIWNHLKPKIIELSNEKESYYFYSNYNGPLGRDRIITGFLFANTQWRENVHSCALLTIDRKDFFDDFVDESNCIKAMLFALSKLLYTVGMEPYKECGIEWIYKLIQKDIECSVTLYNNTLYYLEEYVGSFVARHRMEFRTNAILAHKTQTILEYMVGQGSQVAFFIREEI